MMQTRKNPEAETEAQRMGSRQDSQVEYRMINYISSISEQFIWDTRSVYGNQKDMGIYAMAAAVNNLAARGAVPVYMGAQIHVPPQIFKSRIHALKKNMEQTARELRILEFCSQSLVQPALRCPEIILSACGKTSSDQSLSESAGQAGQDIVLTKWIGLEGMLRVVGEKHAELSGHFTPAFMKQIEDCRSQIFAGREIDTAIARGVSAIRQVEEGGILAALWNLAAESDAGITVDMKKISIRQETIEICEYYRLNPYQLTSAGCMLMVTDSGDALAETLSAQGVMASVIGKLTDSNDKIIRNGEDVRYIDRPGGDELNRLFE